MTRLTGLHARVTLVLGAATILLSGPRTVDAQGLVQGVQQGAREGNKAAGPVGGVLGGAIGGVVGVVSGVAGAITGKNPNQQATTPDAKQSETRPGDTKQGAAAKTAKDTAKATKLAKQAKPVEVLTQPGEPQLTAEQIVAGNDADIERIKTELNLTLEQEKNWSGFSSAMHYLGHDPPDDIVEQMRNEAQFLVDRAADQRNVADAAEPLYSSLDDKQKQVFVEEMVRLSHERGLD
jgi:hypothetical protein